MTIAVGVPETPTIVYRREFVRGTVLAVLPDGFSCGLSPVLHGLFVFYDAIELCSIARKHTESHMYRVFLKILTHLFFIFEVLNVC